MKKELLLILITAFVTYIIPKVLEGTIYSYEKKLSVTALPQEQLPDSLTTGNDSTFLKENRCLQKIMFKNDGEPALENLRIAFDIPEGITLLNEIRIETIPAEMKKVIKINKEMNGKESEIWNIDILNKNNAIVYSFLYKNRGADSLIIKPIALNKDMKVVYTNNPSQNMNPYKIWTYVSIGVIFILIIFIVLLARIIIQFLNAILKMFYR